MSRESWTEHTGEHWLVCSCDHCGNEVDMLKEIDGEDICFECFKKDFVDALPDNHECCNCDKDAEFEFENEYFCEGCLMSEFDFRFSDVAE